MCHTAGKQFQKVGETRRLNMLDCILSDYRRRSDAVARLGRNGDLLDSDGIELHCDSEILQGRLRDFYPACSALTYIYDFQ